MTNLISEQEFGDIHVFHKSVYPLVIRLILLNLIMLVVMIGYNLLVYLAFPSLTFTTILILNIFALLMLQVLFAITFIFVSLHWLGDMYIVQFPQVIFRRGIITIDERKVAVRRVSDIILHQSLLGKIFDYGTVIVKNGIRGGADLVLYDIPKPDHIVPIFQLPPAEKK